MTAVLQGRIPSRRQGVKLKATTLKLAVRRREDEDRDRGPCSLAQGICRRPGAGVTKVRAEVRRNAVACLYEEGVRGGVVI